jgi:uncharacterized protein
VVDVYRFPLLIASGGTMLAARLHRNVDDLREPQPALVISGSWLTVKEQMADRYATEFARRGYTVLTFDFAGFGKSGGEPRQIELPARKIDDIVAVTRFMQTLSCVRGGQVGYVAICASAQYMAPAVELGAPIASLASIAGWYHDVDTVAAYYGGAQGVAMRVARARSAIDARLAGTPLPLVPAYEQGNDRAGMFIPLDYYSNPARGAIAEWRNEMDEATWVYWLSYDGLRRAERFRTPTLFVHGDECALPDNLKRVHDRMNGEKELIWTRGFQVDFYDRSDLVTLSVDAASAHFGRTLKA